MKQERIFVWDFHGVLEKGTENAALEISNLVLEKCGFTERLTREDTLTLFGKKWHEYFAFLLPHESERTHLFLEDQCYIIGNKQPELTYRYTKANDYAIEVLDAIRQQGYRQILLSNTRLNNLREFLRHTHIDVFFPVDCVFGNDQLSKIMLFKRYLDKNPFSKAIIIGDSPGDMALASLVDSTTYLYAHPYLNFREAVSTYKIRDLREILREIKHK